MKSFLECLFGILLIAACALSPARATNQWAGVYGDPCCGVPDEAYVYLSADEACGANVPVPADQPCNINYRNVRSFYGPQNAGGCAIDSTCNCAVCGVRVTLVTAS